MGGRLKSGSGQYRDLEAVCVCVQTLSSYMLCQNLVVSQESNVFIHDTRMQCVKEANTKNGQF